MVAVVTVTLRVDGPAPQRRATVVFRIVLAIPHLILLAVLSMVATVVVFLAWFAVLFTARMPPGMGDFLRRVLQYQARVIAYSQLLLTDMWPPFDIGPREYPVMLDIDEPDEFNRAAVLFRFFLQLPALIVSQLATAGSLVIMFFVWLVTLISARVPSSAYFALACILRYQMHTYAYIGMLTSEYPRGLFGDREGDWSLETLEAPTSPKIDQLVLSRGAKGLVWLALLLGLGMQAVNIATASLGFGSTRTLRDADATFDDEYEEWNEQTRACAARRDVDCQREADSRLRFAIEDYENTLFEIRIPESAADEAVDVVRELSSMYETVSSGSELAGEQARLQRYFDVVDAKARYDERFEDLLDAVAFS
jgi:hypothetical protein